MRDGKKDILTGRWKRSKAGDMNILTEGKKKSKKERGKEWIE
jgi:hypothetical protein